MKIHCLFILRKGETSPELINSIDEFTREEVPEQFEAECDHKLGIVRSEMLSHAYVDIQVSAQQIMRYLQETPTITGTVLEGANPVPSPGPLKMELITQPPSGDDKEPSTTCQIWLMNNAKSYPRSCPTCGLAGKCHYGQIRKPEKK